MDFEITTGNVSDIDELEELWLQMLSHHRDLVGGETPVCPDEPSWSQTREVYARWLMDNAAILRLARSRDVPGPAGYAICHLSPRVGRTFDLGAVHGEVDSLVVHDRARGQGLGTALLDAIRRELVDRQVMFWSIGFLAQNAGAAKLYKRLGFRPWTEELIAETGSG